MQELFDEKIIFFAKILPDAAFQADINQF